MTALTCWYQLSINFSYPSGASNCFFETVTIEGENITYYYYTIGDISYIQHQSNGQTFITERNDLSGIVQMNGKYVGNSLNKSSSVSSLTIYDDSVFSARALGSRVKYDTYYNDITSDIIELTSWTAAIAACLGITVKVVIGTTALTDVIDLLVQKVIPTVYYQENKFYWDPIVTQRHRITSCYYFYE